jgi:hypothetical protein
VPFHNLTDPFRQLVDPQHRTRPHHEDCVRARLDAACVIDSRSHLPAGAVSRHGAANLARDNQAVPARAVISALCGVNYQVWSAHGLSFSKNPSEVGR